MPTLNWIGKDKVINHHLDVPYKVLEHQYGFENGIQSPEETNSGNKIIHGDNLEALKSLLPEYEGKIKCIYIDPPYNTGNEGWVYNDNVNDPKIKKWLNGVVGKEGEDLSRHDKWLCMMYPRIKLLHKLLSDDGAIFVSIDDNEQAVLKLMMDEIFGANNFIVNICWQKKQSPQNDAINISDMHDFVVVYAKRKKSNRFDQKGWNRNLIVKTEEQNNRYKNPDDDLRGPWTSGDCSSNKTKHERPNLYYPIINSITGAEIWPSEKRVWRYEKNTFKRLLDEGRISFGKDGKSFPRLKLFKSDTADGVVPSSWWTREFAGDNQESRKTLRSIFNDGEMDFTTPKPTTLIERIISIGANCDDIILDSFAGSGSTGHAVLNLNAADEGNRKFILIEMEDYAETITSERIKRVMNGYSNIKGTGGAFNYYQLGAALFTENDELNEEVGIDKLRNYIFYTETNQPLSRPLFNDNEYFLNSHNQTNYYFYYKANELTALDDAFLSTIKTKAEQYIIYADNCLLNAEYMKKQNIVFKKIPRDISKF